MDSPNRIENMNSGRNESMNPTDVNESVPWRCPSWNTYTMSPYAAMTDARFIRSAFRGSRMLRKNSSSTKNDSSRTRPTTAGSLFCSSWLRSVLRPGLPPTSARIGCGRIFTASARIRLTSSSVCVACAPCSPTTSTRVMVRFAPSIGETSLCPRTEFRNASAWACVWSGTSVTTESTRRTSGSCWSLCTNPYRAANPAPVVTPRGSVTTTCTGATCPSPKACAVIPAATRGPASAGRMFGPDDPSLRFRAGAARTPRITRPLMSAGQGRLMISLAHRCHQPASASRSLRMRSLLTRGPIIPSSAGSSVSAARPARATAIIAPKPIELNAAIRTSCVPVSASTTVRAETNTAFPLDAVDSAMATSTSRPARSRSRNLLTMNSA